MMRRCCMLVLLVACQRDKAWSDRPLEPTDVPLGPAVKVKVSLPHGLSRTNAQGDSSARFEPAVEGGPIVSVYVDAKLSQALVTNAPVGSMGFERRDLPNGQGFIYFKDGPHVHTTRTILGDTVACDGFFLGSTREDFKRSDLLWRICTSIE